MNYDLLLHMDMESQETMDIALGNIENYMLALPDETFQIVLVANGPAVKLFKKANFSAAMAVTRLHEKGAKFKLCANSLKKFAIPAEEIIEGCEAIQAGIVAIVRMQREGFAYVRP
ncbi:MAG: DsrE family protein [Desulfovibrio sp.]|nr:DsrE family protein [Desulfovibrio sp.]MBI4960263.1 DsrE family protein [Desulfovibrio sp.]